MKRLKLLLPVMALLLCLGGCGESEDEGQFLEVQDSSQEEEGKVINISNDRLEFVMNADTTQFSVTNKNTGQTWFSNPQTAEEDTLSNGVNKTMLSSTLIVKYSDSKGQDFTYDNYQYSIKNKNYSVEVTKDENGKENGVKILYTVGDVQKTYMVPHAILIISRQRTTKTSFLSSIRTLQRQRYTLCVTDRATLSCRCFRSYSKKRDILMRSMSMTFHVRM